jgi:hypothetical protein
MQYINSLGTGVFTGERDVLLKSPGPNPLKFCQRFHVLKNMLIHREREKIAAIYKGNQAS